MIKGLGSEGFVSKALTPETQPEPAPESAAQPPSQGISSFTDGFERANPNSTEYLLYQRPYDTAFPVPPKAPQEQFSVDASTIFDIPQPPQPEPQAAPVDDGLGKTLEDLAEKKIVDTYKSKTNKDYGPPPKNLTESTKYGDSKMPENLSRLGGGGGNTIGELQGSWNAAEFGKIDENAEGDWGSLYAKGSTKVIALDGQMYYNIGVDPEKKTITIGAGAKGSAEIVGAHYEFGYSTPDIQIGNSEVDIDTKVNADAWAGGKGNAGGEITLGKENKGKLEASGFAGGNASLSGNVGIGDGAASADGNIVGWAGVGAKAGAEFGVKDGEFSLKAGFGLALGLGLEWDLGLKVDYGKVAKLGLDGMREIGLDDEANWISDRGDDLVQYAGDAAHWAGDTAEDAAAETAKAIEEAVKAAQKTIDDTFGFVKGAAENPGNTIDDIIEAGEEFIEDVGDTAGDVLDDIGDWF